MDRPIRRAFLSAVAVSARVLAGSALVVCVAQLAAVAHETDQYTVPRGREFADLRLYFAESVHDKLTAAVKSTNASIRFSLASGRETSWTGSLQSPETIAWAVLLQFPPVVHHVETLELELLNPSLRQRYPGLVVSFQPPIWIYHHWALLLDITKPVRLARSSTIMVDGSYFGTDKVVHFVHMGYLYHAEYRRAKAQGVDDEEAVRRAIALGAGNGSLISENAFLGLFSTGVRSNADLASNYAGFKFFRNLTEEVRVRGELRPPLLVRDGPYWKLNSHVRPNSDFFTVFISDHWDEALNPCTYAVGIAPVIREQVRARCDDLLDWYHDEEGRHRTADQFNRIRDELSTYYGEDYGHEGSIDDLITLAECFAADDRPAERSLAMAPARAEALRDGAAADEEVDVRRRDRLGRTALWWAGNRGRPDEVRRLIDAGAGVDAADLDGETPLHAAARWGHTAAADVLLQRGADPNAAARYGTTPLHLAARNMNGELVKALIAHGADVNRQDAFGCSPLHDAAIAGAPDIVMLLVSADADVNVRDASGATPLLRAAGHGRLDAAACLLSCNADVTVANALGRTPIDEARAHGQRAVLELLSGHQATGSVAVVPPAP